MADGTGAMGSPIVAAAPEVASPSQRRRFRWAAGAIVAVVVAPAVSGRDSFPISSYPVYASVRGREERFDLAYGLTAAGEQRKLSMEQLATTDDPLVARSEL